MNDVIKRKRIPIEQYVPVYVSALSALKLKPVNELQLSLENKNWNVFRKISHNTSSNR